MRRQPDDDARTTTVRAMADEGDGLGLDEVLAALRHDLLAAQRASGGENTGLGVREVQIELEVEVTHHVDGEGRAGVKWFVLSGEASGRASRDRTSTNRITLTLGPVLSSGGAAGDGDAAEVPTTSEPVAGSDVSAGVIPRAVADTQLG